MSVVRMILALGLAVLVLSGLVIGKTQEEGRLRGRIRAVESCQAALPTTDLTATAERCPPLVAAVHVEAVRSAACDKALLGLDLFALRTVCSTEVKTLFSQREAESRRADALDDILKSERAAHAADIARAEGDAPPVSDAEIAAAELASREEALAAREAAVATKEAAFAEGQRQDRAQEDDAFLGGLVAAGRLAPGCKSEVAVFCAALGDGEAIAFAEGGEAEDPRARFKAFLDKHLGQSIHLDEVAGAEGLRFAEGQSQADLEAAIDAEMTSAAAAGHPISAAEASRRAKSRR